MTDHYTIPELVAELRDLYNLFEDVPGPRGQESRYQRLRETLVAAADTLHVFDRMIAAEEAALELGKLGAQGDGS